MYWCKISVTVSLSQENQECTLIVENDGAVVDAASDTRKKGGMGTKLMAELTESLPGGVWSRVALADGGMRVQLLWQQRF